jgi:hypothetical protein
MQLTLLHLLYFSLINLAIVLFGWLIIKKKMVVQSWMLFVVSILVIHFIFLHQFPILRMLALIATTFTAMKVIAVSQSYKNKLLTINFKQWATFALGWAGMRAQPFETLGAKPLPNAWPMIRFGISRVIAGILLILLARFVVTLHLPQNLNYILISGMLLIGFSLVLHFGLLSISAGMWRLSGVNTYYLFRQPATATSLTEFWSKRWNIAFSEMTSITIFRPLSGTTGRAIALMLSFAFSGLLHELALSVPVNSGYGMPMMYFIIQGTLVLIEKILIDHNILFFKNKTIARLWVFFWLVIPMPLLFHAQFIKQILWPLAGLSI